jgi:hypothetical protein
MATYTNQAQVRAAFWREYHYNGVRRKPSEFWGKSQNQLPADIRCAFVDFVDGLARDNAITERMAERVTL